MRDYIDLTLLTLEGISKTAGRPIDEQAYLESIEIAMNHGLLFEVRRNGILLSYATLKDMGSGTWFILMFVTHPYHRTKQVFGELFSKIIAHLETVKACKLVSNVLKVNKLSLAFHRKLGFTITREADIGFEFTMDLDSPNAQHWKQWSKQFYNEINA
ncbi:GNAT family N-acetyltransferase [Spartinivicinus poritis]|uniref:GNAT family N-acetyltransferase n=1 Tax=Spartinivicinus poritis TaxID=2994640 RepID=A0ABT5UE02_9GAMM|nr:GNAT family N-acetyltransferase [Spartinivicinus sp. A2-2]MDE1463708.1 GNAT family N-acetyltransferase [Spartinivicinus sp. A2-2]